MFKTIILTFFIAVFFCVNLSFAQCPGGQCNRKIKTPIRSYFQKVKPIRHALMLDKK